VVSSRFVTHQVFRLLLRTRSDTFGQSKSLVKQVLRCVLGSHLAYPAKERVNVTNIHIYHVMKNVALNND